MMATSFGIVAIALIAFVAQVYCQTELLSNEGFEAGMTSWIAMGVSTASLDNDAHSGGNSIKISGRTKIWQGPLQVLSLNANLVLGIAHRVSGFVKILPSVVNQSPQSVFITIRYTLQDGSKKFRKPVSLDNITPEHGWVSLTSSYKIDENMGQLITELALYVAGPDPGIDFLVDTMSLRRAQLLDNPEFENALDPTTNWNTCNNFACSLSSDSQSGAFSILTSSRTENFQGPTQTLHIADPNILVGRAFYLSAHVKTLNNAGNPQDLNIHMRYDLQDSSKRWRKPAKALQLEPSNGWVEIAADYVVEDFGQPLTAVRVYVAGAAASVDFLTDAFTMTEIRTDPVWQQEALARIDLLRKGTLGIDVTSSTARSNVTVKIEQLKHEFGFGALVDSDLLQNNPLYKQWYLDNFEWAAIRNHLKWRQTELIEGQFTWETAETALNILEQNGKTVRGQSILWGKKERNPLWVQSITDSQVMYDKCMKRIDDILNKFKNRFVHWRVNNEMLPVDNDLYMSVYGSPQISYDMYSRAKLRDPNATLYINEYNVVSSGQYTNQYIALAKEFQTAGAPVEGMGVQSHLKQDEVVGGILLNRLDRLATVGLPIFISELDYVNPDVNIRAQKLEEALTAYFSHPQIEGVTLWGYWEGQMWKDDASLVDGPNLTPNAAGQMWLRLFHTDWRSNVEENLGTMSASQPESLTKRVFYGDYKISVLDGAGTVLSEQNVKIEKSLGSLQVNINI